MEAGFMNMQSKNIYSLLAAVFGLIGFFFQFFETGNQKLSGFETAFLFSGTAILVFFAFLLFLTGVVLTFLRMDFLSGMAYIATALFILIFRITKPTGGAGVWWSAIFFLLSGILSAFGDSLPLPVIRFERPQNAAYRNAPQYQPVQEVPQPGVFYCTNCGTQMDTSMNFCPGCGARY